MQITVGYHFTVKLRLFDRWATAHLSNLARLVVLYCVCMVMCVDTLLKFVFKFCINEGGIGNIEFMKLSDLKWNFELNDCEIKRKF